LSYYIIFTQASGTRGDEKDARRKTGYTGELFIARVT
jgi:hypothetical protein